jgi:steroid delta-isomerase-like uncharacterized protein
LALLNAYATAFPDFRLAIDDMTVEDDRVAVRYSFAGTHLGPLADLPATGKHVEVKNGVGVFRLAGGKIVRVDFMWDKYAIVQQLGVLPGAIGV